jgi:aryl sulfotransferase
MTVRAPTRDCILWQFDSRRWTGFQPRPDDIVIATYPKSGTTWAQRIISMLVLQSAEPMAVMDASPWLDGRFRPLDAVRAALDAQSHRRFLKSHLPADALPIHDSVRYVHVARDGRDAALSYHHHLLSLRPEQRAKFTENGLSDPALGRPFPETPESPTEYFHRWITQAAVPGASDGLPLPSWFDFERSWWDLRERENVLLVHYADLKADLDGEMRRIAGFLGIGTPSELWPRLVEEAGFAAMKKRGAGLLGKMGEMVFRDGGAGFIHEGTNGRWRGLFDPGDLALYAAKLARLPPECAAWLSEGRLATSALPA